MIFDDNEQILDSLLLFYVGLPTLKQNLMFRALLNSIRTLVSKGLFDSY